MSKTQAQIKPVDGKPNDGAPPAKTFSELKMQEREKIYKSASDFHNPPEEPKAKPQDYKPEKPPESRPASDVTDGKQNKGPAPQPPAEPGTGPVKPGVGKEDDRTVPHAALHEARIEIKSLKKDNLELQDQVRTLLKDLKDLTSKPADDVDPSEPVQIADYDQELLNLRKEVKELRDREQARDKMTEAERMKHSQDKLRANLQQTHQELEKEGFEGFQEFIPLVSVELQRLASTDKEEAQRLDNPEGWKKIYKENVYPKITGLGKKQSDEEKTKEKEALKTDASLLMPGATKPSPKKNDEDTWSYEQYMKNRVNRSPQTQRRVE